MRITRFALLAAVTAAPVLATPIAPDALDDWRTGWMTPGASGPVDAWPLLWNSRLRPDLFGGVVAPSGLVPDESGPQWPVAGDAATSGYSRPASILLIGWSLSAPTNLIGMPTGGVGDLGSSFLSNGFLGGRPQPFGDVPISGGVSHKMIIPEPMMTVLFGLTGLVMLRRRCR